MIGFLSGLVKTIRGQQTVILVGGVGYTVFLPVNHGLVAGRKADLYIHTHVREDALTLYGFLDEAALNLFEQLLTVSGVGPKSALTVISVGNAGLIKKAIENSNLNFFTTIPGIGKKSAQKIIIELKPKLTRAAADLTSLEGNPELVQALAQLGFTRTEINAVLGQVDPTLPLPNQIKQALKTLS